MMRMTSRRMFNKASTQLTNILEEKIATQRKVVKQLKDEFGNTELSKSTIGSCYGGMRGVTGLVYEPSLLDADEGIRFRGMTIPECQEALPKFNGGTQMMPEAMLWLLLTGEVPTQEQANDLATELHFRATNNEDLNKQVLNTVNALPKDLHPMNQFAMTLLALGQDSKFAQEYSAGTLKKNDMWKPCLEDTLNCMARMIQPTAQIYRNVFHDGKLGAGLSANEDWTGNFMNMMGRSEEELKECMRMYLCIHTDHEGGNVSAHATMLVGSTLADPYLSFAGGMTGLAGPLHGLANQEVLSFLRLVLGKLEDKGQNLDQLNDDQLADQITVVANELLAAGQVIPGYGHAVLRKTDPRFTAQRDFALQYLPNSPLFRLVSAIYKVVPGILDKLGKVKNPWPNVDAHSGCLLQHYDLTEENFYTVFFGLSRGLGVLSALTWERALAKPIERPKTITTEALCKKVGLKM